MLRNTLYDLTNRMPYLDADTGASGGAGEQGSQDGQESPGSTSGQGGAGSQGANTPPTFDDMLKTPGFQAEFDRRMTKALQTTEEKARQETEARIAAAKTEAEKLARMTAEQKAEHEQKQREHALADREAALVKRELRAQAVETLTQKGLPSALLDTLDYADAAACSASIDAMEKAFRAAVQQGVEDRMRGKPPAAPKAGESPKDAFNNLPLIKQMEYAREHPAEAAEYLK